MEDESFWNQRPLQKGGSLPKKAESLPTQGHSPWAKQIAREPELFVAISQTETNRRSSRLEKTASDKTVKQDTERIPSCLQQFQKSDTSTRTFHFYGTGRIPKFATNVDNIFACEGLHYCKKGQNVWLSIAQYMEVSVKFRHSKVDFSSLFIHNFARCRKGLSFHGCSLPQWLELSKLLVAAMA